MTNGWIRGAALLLLAAAAPAQDLKHAAEQLRIGFAQVDITPAQGVLMTGQGVPPGEGVDDPLMARALVAQSRGRTIAIVSVDLVKMRRDLADAAIALACERTGIARDAVMICATHNHSSPFVPMKGPKNKDYLSMLPARIADSIDQAYKALQPARMFVGRSLVFNGIHNRRVISKADGLVLNTWLKKMSDMKQTPQLLGTEGPIDPELWVARFDTLNGRVLGTLVNFTCNPNMHDRSGRKWSADYPGVIAAHMVRAYGKQALCVFTLGAAGNVSPNRPFDPKWRQKAAAFARSAVYAARHAIPIEGPIAVGYARRDLEPPYRNPKEQRQGAVARLGWRESIGGLPPRSRVVAVNAARIGPLGIATNAGELFVEWGLSIKKRSPFPYTIVSEMTNGWVGYEPTAQGFRNEGYEALSGVAFLSLEGIQMLVDAAVELLQQLWEEGG